MNHTGTDEVCLGKQQRQWEEVHRCRRVHVGVPRDAGVGGPRHVRRLDVLLVVSVAGQLLEQEVVQTLLGHQALDGDDGGLHTLDEAQHRGRHAEAVLQAGVDLEAGQVQVKGRAPVSLLRSHFIWGLSRVRN